MDSEKDVICADEILLATVPALIFFLNLITEEEGQVENLRASESGTKKRKSQESKSL
jgi:hypothetical protein